MYGFHNLLFAYHSCQTLATAAVTVYQRFSTRNFGFGSNEKNFASFSKYKAGKHSH
jgi:hypothetical protein